jgi:hypothetical protein
MPPIRRYLRITKHSVLECRIFLENPADRDRWLLDSQEPALNRIFDAVKPFVLPKLREENERVKGKGKGKKKKSVKDVIQRDDFEVAIFLTEIGTRHALLAKIKTFEQKPRIKSNSNKLLGGQDRPMTINEESDDEGVKLHDVPARIDVDSDDDDIDLADNEDKKKLGFTTSYDGFNIWGFVLCLLVERKGGPGKKGQSKGTENAQGLMEEWIATQREQEDD